MDPGVRSGILLPMDKVYSIEQGLGRYECTSGGSSKYWECWPDADNPGTYATRWGKIGTKHSWNRCKRAMGSWEALDKINEKRASYSWVHSNHGSLQEAVAHESASTMHASTPVADVPPPAPARRF